MKHSISKHIAASLTCVGLLTAGAAAFAQEAPQSQDQYSRTAPEQTQPTSEPTTPSGKSSSPDSANSSKHSAMKDCVARERASNSSLSESDAKKACHDAMKAQKNNPDYQPH
jgi:hypothetical protein